MKSKKIALFCMSANQVMELFIHSIETVLYAMEYNQIYNIYNIYIIKYIMFSLIKMQN